MGWIFGAWPLIVGLMAAMAIGAGIVQSKTPWGIFIDSRDTWSLTQFQLVLWTFAILPVFFAVVIGRAIEDSSTAWNIAVPGEVWGALGISLGSTALAVAVKAQKNGLTDTPLNASGRILARVDASKAKFTDMLAYDEGAGSLKSLDVTKFQNLVITVGLVATYVWNVGWMIAHAKAPDQVAALPGFTGVAISLLGISHAGYLAAKVIPQSGIPATTENETLLASAKFHSPVAAAATPLEG